MNEMLTQNDNFDIRCQRVLQVAQQLFQERPDWVTFFRETLGVNGAARSVFPDQQEYVQFEQSKAFYEIQSMVASLRIRKNSASKNEPTKVITVRLPESLHEALKAEASDHNTSMNKLCISKLLQVLVENEEQSAPARPATPTPQAPQTPRTPQASHAPQPPQSPSFRSTYTPPSRPNDPNRFGQ
ncbi:MAG: toxin-antitoxin system HicB family antitoxin [Planctomycetota bacterium]